MSAQEVSGDVSMTIVEHLEELRDRLIVIVVALAVSTGFSFFYMRDLMVALTNLVGKDFELLGLSPMEQIVAPMKVALIAGIALAMPVIIYEVVRYLLPALTPQEKRYLYMLLPGGTISFMLGLAFAYFAMLPAMLNFLQGFMGGVIKAQWSADKYISFVTTILFWMGLVFELPLVMFFLAKLRIVTARVLIRFWRFWVLIAAVIAAIITPTPDPINMGIVMIPLIALYGLGILLTLIA